MSDVNDRRPGVRTETGFTIVETVIAIAIFSFLIIFCLGMFIFVGRIYYRGLYEGQTQEAARSVVDGISESLRSSGEDVFEYFPTGPNSEGWKAYCIGGYQYSFRENIQLITEETPGDRQAGEVFIVSNVCKPRDATDPNHPTPPVDCDRPLATPPTPAGCAPSKVELLHEKMRLLSFAVNRKDDGFYEVGIKIALGGDMSDLEFDSTVFRYADDLGGDVTISSTDPRIQWVLGSCTLPAHTNRRDCEGAGETWTPPRPQAAAGYFDNLQTAQCQSGETFCALIEFKTKAFRRVF